MPGTITARIRNGVIFGLIMATLFSAYVAILFLFRGNAPFRANDVTLLGVIGAYYASGLLGGAVVGLFSGYAGYLFYQWLKLKTSRVNSPL